MTRQHRYDLSLRWTGNIGSGTSQYDGYSRDHEISAVGVGTLACSADPALCGDPNLYKPEQLLVASIAQCHMLWYLSLAATTGIVVTAYQDEPRGVMVEKAGGEFTQVVLRPQVTITTAGSRAAVSSSPPELTELATGLHDSAADFCVIARSVNFPVHHEPQVVLAAAPASAS